MKNTTTLFKVGDNVECHKVTYSNYYKITKLGTYRGKPMIEARRIGKNSHIEKVFTLRSDGRFVEKGWTMEEAPIWADCFRKKIN